MPQKVKHFLSCPHNFNPPFRANVCETYELAPLEKDLKNQVSLFINSPHPFLKMGLAARAKLINPFGFKAHFKLEDFNLEYINPNELRAHYEDPHFSFFAQMINDKKLTLYCALHYKSEKGLIYYWAIYLAHVNVIKNILRSLHKY